MPKHQISHENGVEAVVRSAWRQRLFVLAVEQLGFAVAVVSAGGILMLLIGTQILNWYWLALLSGIGIAVSAMRVRRRMLTRYRIAQVVDSRLHLNDSLSTALFLLTESERRDDPMARLQIERAEELATSVRPARVFAVRMQRCWAAAGALVALMFGLFALRYLVQSNLSMEQSLIPTHFRAALERIEQSLSGNQPVAHPSTAEHEENPGRTAQSERNYGRGDERLQDSKLGQEADPTNQRQSASPSPIAQENQKPPNAGPENGTGEDHQRNAENGAARENSGQANTMPSTGTNNEIPAARPPSSGLLEKMKDAVSSLLAKMKTAPNSQGPPQNGERSPEGNRTEEESAAKNDQQGQSPNAGRERTRNDPSSEGGEQGQTREKAEASQGRNSDRSPDNNGSDAHSGIGRQNGDKDLKEAEQLQAMGKLAEIIGKRSANLTGEVTVETSSGKQRLKTEDSQRVGRHSDTGGEINRDEIPLMYQQYVREYMERVHKQAKSSR